MADRYWVGGTANWDGTAGTKWATMSGGSGGAAVPTSADDVYFDANSGAVTCTIASGNTSAKSITCTGFTGTLAGSAAITVSGSVTLVAGMTVTYSGTLTLNATGTLTTAGKTLGSVMINGSDITVTLGGALTSLGVVTLTQGTFTTNNYNITATTLSSNNINTRTINLGSSTVTLSGSGPIAFSNNTNLTFNAGTSSIVCTNSAVTIAGGAQSATGVTFYNVSFTSTTAGTRSISSVNTFNNLSVTAPSTAGVTQVTFNSPQTINGTLSTTGTAGNCRVWFRGVTYGIAQTLTINSATSLTDADFRNIYVIGTSAPISGTRIGNRGECSGITFSTPKTVYWNLAGAQNWSADGWAVTSTGSPSTDNFPLPQDTATFTNSGSVTGTITLNTAIGYVPSVDMSNRTSAMTLSIANATTVYGNWTNGSGVTLSGTATLTFSGGGTQTITSAGVAVTYAIAVDSYGGTVQLADAFTGGSGSSITVTNGTFDTKNYNVTISSLLSTNSNIRTIKFGSSTLTLSDVPGIDFTTSTNLTFDCGTSTVICSSNPASDTLFRGGGQTFYNVSFSSLGSGTVGVTGQNIILNNFTITAPTNPQIKTVYFTANQTINGTFTCAGATAVRRIFVQSDTIDTSRTLTVGTLSAQDCDFRDITIAGAAAGSSPTRAGNCGGNSGITFPAAKTVYWNLAGAQNWSATGWATSSGGSPDINNFPLAQDTAVFNEAASSVTGTITINTKWNIGTFDASARTSAMTLTTSTNTPVVYGDWKFGTGVTSSSTTGTITFSKSGTQTITSNGIQFGCPVTINHPSGTVELADALSLDSARTLTLTSGIFNAVTYNVTTGLFSAANSTTLKMGSGTWTLSGTGTVWDIGALTDFFRSTSEIVLSNTSTSARTFTPGTVVSQGLVYNKLTIGGTTGTSTLTISGAATFIELASTKTVAHTIVFPSSTSVNIGKWSVTGTSGNVVTLAPSTAATTYTLSIFGAATSGIDYLSISYCTVATTSPGEFYVGANSTNTAGNVRVIFTAPPTSRTLYWVGGTGNWSDTARWSLTSNGTGGEAIPTSLDAVNFDSGSNATAYTATIDAGVTIARCASFTMAGPTSGNVTFAGTVGIAFHGNVSFAATGITRTHTGTITLSGSTTGKTFTTNGLALANNITINGKGCGWVLGSALDNGASNTVAVSYGNFDLNNYNLTVLQFSSGSALPRTINCGSSTITQAATSTSMGSSVPSFNSQLTFNAGTSQFNISYFSASFSGNGNTFYNVSFTSNTAQEGTISISGINTFNNLTFAAVSSAGIRTISLSDNQTINGTLTIGAGTNSTCRQYFISSNALTARTLTCNAVASLSDVDFRDITIAGTAAPVSGTRLGDCKGNSGITFPTAKTVYWRNATAANWGANAWSDTSGGTASLAYFPLAQDTAVFPSAYPNSGVTVTLNASYNIGTIDMSLRTSNTITLDTGTTTPQIYGNWINGTGTILTGTGALIFAGRGSQTITSAGKTFTQNFTIDNPSGSVTLQDAFTASQSSSTVLTITQGTFNANTYNVTLSGAASGVSSSNSNTRTIAIGSGTWTVAGTGGWTAATSTNLTVTGTGTISLTSASAKTFAGGGLAYTNITLDQGGAGTLTITGNNTFKNISNSYSATGATAIAMGTTTQRVAEFTAMGTVGKVLTIQGTSASSPCTLIFTGSIKPDVDYLSISGVRAYDLNSNYAGNNSTNLGSLGWIFSATSQGSFLMFF